MWLWDEHLKLGKTSVFVKRDLRVLPLTDAEVEADFFLDRKFSAKRREAWCGIVVERESGDLLALEDVRWPPPTVNDLATLLARAMTRPPRRPPASTHHPSARSAPVAGAVATPAVEAQKDVELPVDEWGRVIFSLCGARQKAKVRKQLMKIARKIAERLSEVLGVDAPPLPNPR